LLVATGCLVKRYPEMKKDLPEVDHFFTPEEIPRIADILAGTPLPVEPLPEPGRMLTLPPHAAYLKIAEGCSNRCTYCTIPDIRGPFVSAPTDALLREARELAAQGTVELNLIAQDVTNFGRDRGEGGALTRLVKGLTAIEELRWIRLLYAYPRPLDPALVAAMAAGGKLLPYLDAPIQHASPRILKAMNRHIDASAMRDFFLDLQHRVPGIVLRTTAIVGFPGETDAEFEALLSFCEDVGFHHLGAFVYSPEAGTGAAKLRKRVPEEVAWERRDRLMALQAECSERRNREFLGTELDVLVEGIDEEGEVVGRTRGQAPEVDGFTRLRGYDEEIVEVGSFVRARVVEADVYDLVAEVVR
jgi:ribosomal protein S12 methylthiotransferase